MGLTGNSSTYVGYLWPLRIQGHFDVIWCTCNFSENAAKDYFFYKIAPKFIKLLLNYLVKGLPITTFGIFEKIVKIEILTFFSFSFLTWDPMGVKITKSYSPLQIAANSFQTCPEFSCHWSSQNYIGDF